MPIEQLRDLIKNHWDEAEFKLLCDDFSARYPLLNFDLLRDIPTTTNYEVRVHNTLKWLERRAEHQALAKFEQFLYENRPGLTPPVALPPTPEPTTPGFNPFGTQGKMKDLRHFVLRQPFTRHLWEELRKGNSLSIVGESQVGKSSLLHYIVQHGPQELKRPAADFVYLDMQLVSQEEEFFDYLCEELGITPCRGGRLARQLRNRPVVVCLDEIEQMKKEHFQHNIRTELRGLADGAPLTLVITSRTELGRLFPDKPDETSPLAGICQTEMLRPFTPAEVQQLVGLVLGGTPYHFSELELEEVFQQTKGHPGRVQQALKLLFRRKYEK